MIPCSLIQHAEGHTPLEVITPVQSCWGWHGENTFSHIFPLCALDNLVDTQSPAFHHIVVLF